MNKNYVSPAIAMSEATTKFSTMITISGHVDNPDDSDSKKRYGFEEEEKQFLCRQLGNNLVIVLLVMKKNYHTPTYSLRSTYLQHSLLLSISGKVENPENSDTKHRDTNREGEQESNPEWGQLW